MAALAASNVPAALEASKLMERGRKSAAALEALLQDATMTSAPGQHGGIRELAEQIFCCLDRALAALHGEGIDDDATGGCTSMKRKSPATGAAEQTRPKRRARATGAERATKIEKRSTPDDGFLWRKYGQKEILNSKHPRAYFRCIYKFDNGCKATRQVQQSEDDPSVYIVTYFGEHTCGMDVDAATTAVVGEDKKSPELVISFGSGSTSCDSAWLSSSVDDVGSNSSRFAQAQAVCLPEEEGGKQKANVCDVESSVPAPQAEPSSSANVSCSSLDDLDSLLQYFDWDSCGDGLFDMGWEYGIHEL